MFDTLTCLFVNIGLFIVSFARKRLPETGKLRKGAVELMTKISIGFEKAKRRKVHEDVAVQNERAIVDEELAQGDKVPFRARTLGDIRSRAPGHSGSLATFGEQREGAPESPVSPFRCWLINRPVRS